MEFSDVTCRVECLESVGETYIGTLLIGNDFLNITDCHDETKNFGVPTAAFCLEPNSVRNWRALRLKPVETVFGPEDAEIKQVSFQHEDPDTMRTMQVVFEGCHLGERSATPPPLLTKIEPITPHNRQEAFDFDHDFGPAGPTLREVAMQSQPARGGRRVLPPSAAQVASQDPDLLNMGKLRGNGRGRGGRIPPTLTDQIPQRQYGEKPRPPYTKDEVREGFAKFLHAPPAAPTVNVAKTLKELRNFAARNSRLLPHISNLPAEPITFSANNGLSNGVKQATTSHTTPHKMKRQRAKEELGATEMLPQSAAQLGHSLADILNTLVETKTANVGVQTDPLELCGDCTEMMKRSKQ